MGKNSGRSKGTERIQIIVTYCWVDEVLGSFLFYGLFNERTDTMKKERIEITKNNNRINFYLTFEGEQYWLFSQDYSMSVYDYFKFGRSLEELRNHSFWRSNPRLAKTIDRIPTMVRYIRKEYELPLCDGRRRYYASTYNSLYTI